MTSRFLLTAAVAASFTAPLGAEPGKVPAPQAATQPSSRPAGVLLASADIRTPQQAGDAQATPVVPKRQRAARVTTCRCAGQLPEQP